MSESVTAREVLEKLSNLVPHADTDTKEYYRIGDLAREFDVSLRTLRFYEDRGLLQPRRSGSTRLYSPEDRDRLKIILLIKSVGFSLVDIQQLLEIYDTAESEQGVERIARRFEDQLGELEDQKAKLQRSIEDLEAAISDIREMM